MPANTLATLDATTIARLVRTKQVSPLEATRATLDAIAELDPLLKSFCVVAADQAVETAREIEGQIMRDQDPGALAGVPVGIKDLVLAKDIRTTFGSQLYKDFVPEVDDVAVERLRQAGAVILGKTNAAEFGYGGFGHNPLFPTTRNPWALDRTPGGSSAGSAAAVAAGLCPLALGSDGGGSVRLPAAFTGIVGIKPTMGRIPLWPGCRDETLPGVSSWESIEHYGPLARTVADAALFLSVTTGPDPRDRLSLPDEGIDWIGATRRALPKGLSIAWCPRWAGLPAEDEVVALAERAALALADSCDAMIEETASPFGDLIGTARAIVALDTDLTGLRALAAGREHQLSPSLRKVLERGWSAEEFTDALTQRKAAVNAMARFMERYDLLLTPTVPLVAFPIDRNGPGTIGGETVEDDAWTPALYPANLTGQPAASVPSGWTAQGLPAGLQIIGRRLADELVITACAAFEAIRPWRNHVPPVSVWADATDQVLDRVEG
jgi:aspartyl-tRNA(Asn)/glutamyl-tRNA(Gln) amidotransferase subunit A